MVMSVYHVSGNYQKSVSGMLALSTQLLSVTFLTSNDLNTMLQR